MHPIYSAYLYFCILYKSPLFLLMEDNNICKYCCSESGFGWWEGGVMLDREGSQTVRLISPFVFWSTHSERFLRKDTNSSRIQHGGLEQRPVRWLLKDRLPASAPQTQVPPHCPPTKCPPSPPFTAPTTGCIRVSAWR